MLPLHTTEDSASLAQVYKLQLPVNGANSQVSKQIITKKIADISKAEQMLNEGMPLTWKNDFLTNNNGRFSVLLLFTKFTGLLATVLAIMMGAPFWFDLLNKISNLRGTGSRPPTGKYNKNK